ncbi:MAG: YoaK family protein [Phycisphaerales bacterium]
MFAGGAGLAAIAGMVNAATLAAGSLPVTHLTGSLSRVSGDIASGDFVHAIPLASITLGFVLGAAISGALVGEVSLRGGRAYGLALIAEACLIALAALLLKPAPLIAVTAAAIGSGMQNALAATYGRLIIRTTHMTGIATDIGVLLGRIARGRPAERWKLALLSALLAAFTLGGFAGWLLEARLGADALLVPAGILLALGLAYRLVKRRLRE